MEESEAQAISQFILSTVQDVAIQTFGDEGRFNQIELMMLSTSLPKMLSQLNVATVERVSNIMWPIAFIGGCGLYGIRILNLTSQKIDEQKEKDKKEWSQPSVNQNEPSNPTINPITTDNMNGVNMNKSNLSF